MRRLIREQRGSQLIEFVALLPILLVVVLIIWQFCLAAYTFMAAGSAARDAARYAATHPGYSKDAVMVAARKMGGNMVIDVVAEAKSDSGYEYIEATVTMDVPRLRIPGLKNLQLRRTAAMPKGG